MLRLLDRVCDDTLDRVLVGVVLGRVTVDRVEVLRLTRDRVDELGLSVLVETEEARGLLERVVTELRVFRWVGESPTRVARVERTLDGLGRDAGES